jgi:hypothetical protein
MNDTMKTLVANFAWVMNPTHPFIIYEHAGETVKEVSPSEMGKQETLL